MTCFIFVLSLMDFPCPDWIPAAAVVRHLGETPEHAVVRHSSPPRFPAGPDCRAGRPRWHSAGPPACHAAHRARSEEHTSELQSLMRISYAVFCLKKKKQINSPQ